MNKIEILIMVIVVFLAILLINLLLQNAEVKQIRKECLTYGYVDVITINHKVYYCTKKVDGTDIVTRLEILQAE